MISSGEASAIYAARYYSVYVLGTRLGQPIKVGMTRHLTSRFSSLQCASPVKLKFLDVRVFRTLPEARDCERRAHEWLARNGRHLHGEWFDAAPADLEAVYDRYDHRTISELHKNGFFREVERRRAVKRPAAGTRALSPSPSFPTARLMDVASAAALEMRPSPARRIDPSTLDLPDRLLAAMLHDPGLARAAVAAGLRTAHFREGLRKAFSLAIGSASPHPCAGTRTAMTLAALEVTIDPEEVASIVATVKADRAAHLKRRTPKQRALF